MNFSSITKSFASTLKKRTPEILTGVGIAGMVATTIMAVRATPKAMELIEETKPETKLDMVKVAWKPYIPAAITGVTSIACLVGASSVNARRNAALATAYTISETALKEYKEKVVETVGEKKEKEIRDAIAQDKLDRHPATEILMTDKGGATRCFDIMTGRYFWSDMNSLKRVENELNERLLTDGSVCLNDLYDLIGGDMDEVHPVGDILGWDTRTGMVKFSFSSHLSSEGVPCLVLDFSVAPRYDYYK